MLSVHLRVLPLNLNHTIVSQKCLLPKKYFPNYIYPGKWAKCHVAKDATLGTEFVVQMNESDSSTNNSAASSTCIICQLFPRDDGEEDICLIDNSVSSSEHSIDFVNYVIIKIECFEEITFDIPKLNVNLELIRKHYLHNANIIDENYLTRISHVLLQSYCFTHNTYVRASELEMYGIESIHIEINELDARGLASISDTTKVTIENVRLQQDMPSDGLLDKSIVLPTVQQVQQELSDALHTVHTQRNLSRTCRLPFCLLLIAPSASGKTTIINDFIYNNKCNAFYMNFAEVMKAEPGETEASIRQIFDSAVKFEQQMQPHNPVVIVMEDLHLLCPHVKYQSANQSACSNNILTLRIVMQLTTLLDNMHKTFVPIMCLASTSSPDLIHPLMLGAGRFSRLILLTPLKADERRLIFQNLFAKEFSKIHLSNKLMNEIANKYTSNYNLTDLALLVRNITKIDFKESKELPAVIEKALNRMRPTYLKGMEVVAYRTTDDFSSIGGMANLKKMLEQTVLLGIRNRSAYLRFGLNLPKGILLYGPPGCCKTSIAKCLATEANMNFISTSGADLYSPFIGKTEKFIANIFDSARRSAPCVIFLDELDTLLGRRCFKSTDLQIRVLSTLLTEMDGIQNINCAFDHNPYILVVAATNRPDMIDAALLRPGRFDKLIHVSAPDLPSRRSILELVATHMPFAASVDLDNMAESFENYSGADIFNICNEAALLAFQRNPDNIEIQPTDLNQTMQTIKPSLTFEQIHWYDEFEIRFQR